MTDFALSEELARESEHTPPPGGPPVKPPWLRPVATVAIIAAHIGVFAALMYAPLPQASALDSISMDLVPQGDFFESQEVSAADATQPPETAIEEPELALPPPAVMAPDAPLLPAKKEVTPEEKKKILEKRREAEAAQERREAQARRRYGAPEGHAQGRGQGQATCLAHVAAALRRHTPGATSLGAGSAQVTFHVNAGGALSGISASGTSAAHAALARRIVASSRGPGDCASAYVSQSFTFH